MYRLIDFTVHTLTNDILQSVTFYDFTHFATCKYEIL
jgi:hypothetical protein